jgi:acyl-CoA synthetase (NDP forming)
VTFSRLEIPGRADSTASRLDPLLAPRSVAVVGASNDWRRFGGRVLHYLKQSGFAGPIYPINPTRAEVQGLKAYPNISAIEGTFDCALLLITAEDSVATIRACAEKGVKAAIVYGAGFAEIGAEGKARQDEMAAIARDSGMRLLGPNCMGLFNARSRFYATFAYALEDGIPAPGRIGMVTQSGGYGGYVMQHAFMRKLSFSHFVTTGNECDVEVGEVLDWMVRQDDVDVILAYMEGVRSGASLINALALARERKKPVVMMKVGRTAEGRAAAVSHTASLTGEDAVYDAVFREYGVYRATTTDEMLDVAYALSKGKLPQGPRTAVISISGGVGVQIADYIGDAKLELTPVPRETQTQLREIVPYCSPANPIDMTGLVTANHDMLGLTLDRVLESNAFDAIVLFLGIVGMAPSAAEPICRALESSVAKHPDRLLLVSVTTPPELRQVYDKAGFLVYEDPSRAIGSLAALHHFNRYFNSAACNGTQQQMQVAPALDGATQFNEVGAKRLLAQCGIPAPKEVLVQTAGQAAAAAAEIGFPVAVKVVSADIAHKTEHGGVALRLVNAQAVSTAVDAMAERIGRELPAAKIDGYLVSEMVTDGIECIVGVHVDATFGPVVTFGLGGVTAEVLRDVVCRLTPVTVAQARSMIEEVQAYPLLAGYRGAPAHDIDALASAIAAVSQLAVANVETISAIEVNPVVVRHQGKGLVALDALIQFI